MLFFIDRFMEVWLLPPGLNLLIMLIGFYAMRSWPKSGKLLVSFSLISLWLLSSPLVSQPLLDKLQYAYPPLSPATLRYEPNTAIVVLEGGINLQTPEFGKFTASAVTLSRLSYAAFIHQRTGIPILVSGNDPTHPSINQAEMMADVLKSFNVPTRWKENSGYNTAQEAIFSSNILKQAGITKIYLVTDALHMARSVYAFRRKGLELIPAPTAFVSCEYPFGKISGLIPTIGVLHASTNALREYIGIAWYRIYYRF